MALPRGIPPTAGTFTLTGDLSFGPSFGLISKYLISIATHPAATGFLRLAHGETLAWRNALNTADLPLGVDAGNNLTFNGATMAFSGAVNPGTANQLAYYATSTNAVSGLTLITPDMALISDANGLPVASGVTAATLAFLDATSSVQTQINAVVTTANAALPKSGGTMTGDIAMGTHSITGMADGVNPQDAATVSQVASSTPSGMGGIWFTNTAPSGWIFVDNGATYAQAVSPTLYTVFGGVGGFFTVPNLADKFPVGAGGFAALLGFGGSVNVNISDPTHNHTQNAHQHTGTSSQNGANVTIPTTSGAGDWPYGTTNVTTTTTAAAGANQGSATMAFANTSPDTATNNASATGITATATPPCFGIRLIAKT